MATEMVEKDRKIQEMIEDEKLCNNIEAFLEKLEKTTADLKNNLIMTLVQRE